MTLIKKAMLFLIVLCLGIAVLGGCTPADSSEAQSLTDSSSAASEAQSQDDISSTQSEAESEPEAQSLAYTALGDSIPYGYALSSRETDCYPQLIADALLTADSDIFENAAVSGMTSPQLASLIATGLYITDVDLITITIGANNILAPFLIDTQAIISKYASYGVSSLEDIINGAIKIAGGDFSNTQLVSALNGIISDLNTYYNSDEFLAKMDVAAAQLKTDIDLIFSSINEYSPEATVVFTTIYSPYKGCALGFGAVLLDMSPLSDLAVSKLNAVIKEGADTYGYIVADIYEAFESSEEQLVNASISMTNIANTNMDPHPNKAGARVIADTILSVLEG